MPSLREKKMVVSKHALFKAIGAILKNHSYAKLSINLVAETADVDKSFIYRHYGDFDGLLRAYVSGQDFFIKNLKKMTKGSIVDHRAFMKKLLKKQFAEVYKNEELQQFLVWGLGDKTGMTSQIAVEREVLAQDIFEQSKGVLQKYHIDLNMIYAIFASATYYLILHKEQSTFCEYDFTEKQDVAEFLKTLEWLIDLVFDKLEVENKLEASAVKAYQKGISVDDIVEITGLSKNKVNLLVQKNG